jgi:uncharacterized Zn finger protein (UPF0148 family)
MSWNNIIPWWDIPGHEACPTCGEPVVNRNMYPGVDCTVCGGTCVRIEDEDEHEAEQSQADKAPRNPAEAA